MINEKGKELSLKEIQSIEFDILIYLDKICKENKIKYYLSSGTLLGAVKYNGFIPWDDDIDVILFRNDYIKLIDILSKSNGKYKLLSVYNTKGYYYPFAKLVDSRTILIENSKRIKEMGVFIDIVPLDGFKTDNYFKEINDIRFVKNLMVRRFRIKNCIRDNFDYMKVLKKKIKNKKLKDVIYCLVDYLSLPLGYNFWTKLYDRLISNNDIDNSKYVGVRTGSFDVKEVYLKKDLIKQSNYIFEGKKFTSFKNYDLYLRKKFGDYEKEPSDDQKISHHQMNVYMKD